MLLLLPTSNKLLLQWKGPYRVLEKKGRMDYCTDVEGQHKVFHANMLRKYVSRTSNVVEEVTPAVVEEEEELSSPLSNPNNDRSETWEMVSLNDTLLPMEKEATRELLRDFQEVWSDVPGRTHLLQHKINLVEEQVLCSRPYKTPYELREEVKAELDQTKELGITEPSNSPYCTPMVVVRQPDGKHRICLDFRILNQVTIFDSEPMSDAEQIMTNILGAKYSSKIDLSKGYWQLPLDKDGKQYTAFQTDQGLFQFTVPPFGLVNAPATFNRLMRMVLRGIKGVQHFLDDILIYSEMWSDHLFLLRQVLTRLQEAGLTAQPSKSRLGMETLDYLAHVIGSEGMWPLQRKMEDTSSERLAQRLRRQFVPS